MTEPRRLGDVLGGTIRRVVSSDQARAYGAWAKAIGPEIAAAPRPRRFGRGPLPVICESSVWASELTYLSGAILAKMAEADPAHPVKRLRFEAGSSAGGQGEEAPAANSETSRTKPVRTEIDEALRRSEALSDEQLKASVRAALAAAAEEPRERLS